MRPHDVDLSSLLWAIYMAEGGCSAKVPFGWLLAENEWKAGQVSAEKIMDEVIKELIFEYGRWRKAWKTGEWPRRDVKERDFLRWLARVGYNANPQEWDVWEKNVRYFYIKLVRQAAKMLALGDKETL